LDPTALILPGALRLGFEQHFDAVFVQHIGHRLGHVGVLACE
jgi:hypothetical protein